MLILFCIGIFAGLIEASAGGSGLISLPTLIFYGLTPLQAIATSKFQYAFGAVAAIVRFERAGLNEWREIAPLVIAAMLAGSSGAYFLTHLSSAALQAIIPFLLIFSAIYFSYSSRITNQSSHPRISNRYFALFVVPAIAGYDGFFGVGSASFYMAAFVLLLGLNIREATARTKIVDFASGVSALIVLALDGHVLLLPGLALGAGQLIGGYLGAGLVLRFGAKWVRPVIVIVSIGMAVDLLVKKFF
ncbi:TSUP family transporter [bacterium]|nr:TSUP family transporter [bacterium]